MASSSLPLRFPLANFHKPKSPPSFRRLPALPLPPSAAHLRLPPTVLRRGIPRLAVSVDGREWESEAEYEAKGHSSLPNRFRRITETEPERPVIWPFVVVALLLVYARKTVLWELSNWKRFLMPIFFLAAAMKEFLILALVSFVQFTVIPVLAYISAVTQLFLSCVKSIYSQIVAFVPVEELCTIMVLTSLVLAISETVSPDSGKEQLHLLSVAALACFGAVTGFVAEFWLTLIGFFCYSKFVKKRDTVSAALPPAAMLAAVGEPWVRALAITAFLAFAIRHHSKSPQNGSEDETSKSPRSLPPPILVAALLSGIHVAAKWIRYRHLTWMIV